MKRLDAAFAVLLVLGGPVALGGCSIPRLLGYGDAYMIVSRDALVLPHEEAQLEVRVRRGSFFKEQEYLVVRFYRGAELYAITATDDDGVARAAFTPPAPGDYRFSVECSPPARKKAKPLASDFTVACRQANTPLCVLDIDKTLCCPRARDVVEGDCVPLRHSVEVTGRLAGDYTIVYLTERPDYLRLLTETWLRRQGYPRGPVIMPRIAGFGAAEFKQQYMAELASRFTGAMVGVGDRASDAKAYTSAGARAYLILYPDTSDGWRSLMAQETELGMLPETVQVVNDWDQIEAGMYRGDQFPIADARRRLARMAEDQFRNKPR